MLAVPVLATLTDRIDAPPRAAVWLRAQRFGHGSIRLVRRWALVGTAIWALAGIGLQAAYMPGLKALTTTACRRRNPRAAITLYNVELLGRRRALVSRFTLVAAPLGWRAAFLRDGVRAAGDDRCLPRNGAVPPRTGAGPSARFPSRCCATASRWVSARYGAHCFELYACAPGSWRSGPTSWTQRRRAAFADHGERAGSRALRCPRAFWATKAAIRFGRHRAITVVMIVSGAVALAIGFLAGASPAWLLVLVLIYAVTNSRGFRRAHVRHGGERRSGQPRRQPWRLHSTVGFRTVRARRLVGGVALDAFRRPASPTGWFAVSPCSPRVSLLGPLALWWSRQS